MQILSPDLCPVFVTQSDSQITWSNDEAVTRIQITFVSLQLHSNDWTKEKRPTQLMIVAKMSLSPRILDKLIMNESCFLSFLFFPLTLDLLAKSSGRCRQSFACAVKKMPFFVSNFLPFDIQWDAKGGTMDEERERERGKSVYAVQSIKTITYTSTFGVSDSGGFLALKKTRWEKRTFFMSFVSTRSQLSISIFPSSCSLPNLIDCNATAFANI